ncbi:Uncharacterized protein LW93_12587 [Fusarium fujikuroi]|nr:Uncharacterized protein LW93_12587 [Fusarium fujikuroi]
MPGSKRKAEAEPSTFHSQYRCSGFAGPPGRHSNPFLRRIAQPPPHTLVLPRTYQEHPSVFGVRSGTHVPLPMFAGLEQEGNADGIGLSNITVPEALPSPLKSLTDSGFSPEGSNGVYRHLPEGDAFRLLEILPGDGGTLQCKLRVCGLSENEASYEALSYTWGEPDSYSDRKIEIIANGVTHSIIISGNLYIALWELRRSDASRLIWADAICINQEDVKERGQQVSLMGRIFNSAWQVIIWLGEERDRCCCGETVLEASLSSVSKAFLGICAIVNAWLAQSGQKTLEATYQVISQDDQYIARHANIEDPGICQSSMMQLFSRRWFSRIWVLQEAVLAKHAIVQLGSYRTPWEWFGLAAAIVVHKPDITLGQAKVPTGAMNSYLMYRLSVSQKCLPGLEFSFAQLLQATRRFACRDPKDKIYGLLGIKTTDSIAAKIVPDYRETTTVQKVYKDIARLMLGSDSPLTFLSGLGTFGKFIHSGPSWVPNWDKHRMWTILPTKQNSGFQCASGAPMETHTDAKVGELILKGAIIGHVSSTQEPRDYIVIMNQYAKCRENLLTEPRWSEEVWRKCAMTLTCGGDGRGYPIHDEVAHLADMAALILAGSGPWVTFDLIALRNFIEPEGDKMTQAKSLNDVIEDGDSRRYMSAAEPVRGLYRLFKTASKDFGLGPTDMKIGDRLCVLFGAAVPFLLRPKGDGYEVVGECYVYDLMHGEVLEKLAADPDGPSKPEWIKLI